MEGLNRLSLPSLKTIWFSNVSIHADSNTLVTIRELKKVYWPSLTTIGIRTLRDIFRLQLRNGCRNDGVLRRAP